MTNIALLGCAHIHTPNFIKRLQTRDTVTVTHVWDHDTARAEAAASQLGAARVAEPSDICSDRLVEAVVICSETDRHPELVIAAAQAGKHLFVEKPLGIRADDVAAMRQAIEAAGVRFQTGYFMRSRAEHLFLKEQLDKGHFGKVTRARCSNGHAGSLGGWFDSQWRWMADPAQAGFGGFGDLGSHALDLLIWLLGEVEAVTATVGVATGRYGACDEFGEGMLRFAGGAVGTLAAGWVDLANPVTLQISGTEGHAHIQNGHLYYKSEHVTGADGATPWDALPPALPHAFELFLDALEGQDAPLIAAREAAYSSLVMAALYEAANSNTWIAVSG